MRTLAISSATIFLISSNSYSQQVAPPPTAVTGRPVVYAQPQKETTHTHSSGPPVELLAILQSLFGAGGGGLGASSGCVGTSEIACPDSGPENYSTDSSANIAPSSTSELTRPYKILGPFKKYFDPCVQKVGLGNCRFVNLGVKGDASHQARRSCHNSMQAIDVGPLTCSSGRKIMPTDPAYFDVAKCMANDTNDELQVIYYKASGPNMIQKSDHNNHMHIQIKNCAMVFG